jgi:hypothetical protein
VSCVSFRSNATIICAATPAKLCAASARDVVTPVVLLDTVLAIAALHHQTLPH